MSLLLFESRGWAQIGGLVLLLDVQVNGHAVDRIGEFTESNGRLFARRSDLGEFGIAVPTAAKMKPEDLVALSTLSGLTWRLDRASQTIFLTAVDSRLLITVFEEKGKAVDDRIVESGKGVLLNYDMLSTFSSAGTGLDGSLELRAFSPAGNFESGVLVSSGKSASSSQRSLVRLDTVYNFADVEAMRRYSAGDFITDSLTWTRPVHMAGLQVRSDFTTRPDLVTFPLPSIGGSTAVPSTINILANDSLVASKETQAGPFQVSQLPVVTGAGTLSMVVTDSLGKQVTINQPFYASAALLAPGLHSFSAQAGFVRRRWGIVSNDYGGVAASGTYRYGLNPGLTLEGSAEGMADALMAGGGIVVNALNLAVIGVAAASSATAGQMGEQIGVNIERVGRAFNLGGSASFASRDFEDMAATNGDPVPRKQLHGNAGLTSRRIGSVGVAYAEIDAEIAQSPGDPTAMQRSRILSGSYSIQMRRMSFLASALQSLSGTSGTVVNFGLTFSLGSRTSLTASIDSGSGNGELQVQQSAVRTGDWGYQAYASAGRMPHNFAQAQYKSGSGMLFVGADQSSLGASFRLEDQGAVSWIDGELFPSNTVNDSFAIVDTGGLKHVHVLDENLDVGWTNARGKLLVADLRSFDVNQLAIEPTDLPLDAMIDSTVRKVRPRNHGGVVVRFPISNGRAALLRLVDSSGESIPVGSVVTLAETGTPVPVGYDGEAYVRDLRPLNRLKVELPDGKRCTLEVSYQPVPGEITTIGPLACHAQ